MFRKVVFEMIDDIKYTDEYIKTLLKNENKDSLFEIVTSDMFYSAVKSITNEQKISTATLMRSLNIEYGLMVGYKKAENIIECMNILGLINYSGSAKDSEVLSNAQTFLDERINDYNVEISPQSPTNVSEDFDFENRILKTSYPDLSGETPKKHLLIDDLGFSNQIKNKLNNCIHYAKGHGISPNILLIGCPAKLVTRIHEAIANELILNLRSVDGRDFGKNSKEGEFTAFLTNVLDHDIICFTHMESIRAESLRLFEQAALTNAIDITIGKGAAARSIHIDLPVFGIILSVDNIEQVPKDVIEIFHEIIDFKKYEHEIRLITVAEFAEKYFLSFDQKVSEMLVRQFPNDEQLKLQLIDIRSKAYAKNINKITESFLQEGLEPIPELDKIDAMDGREFELFTGTLLRGNGFENVNVTQASYDFGVDVIAEKDDIKYAIQCKRYNGPIGVSAVQEVIASKSLHDCHVACVLTNSSFTPAAIELAKKNLVILWDRNKLQKFIDKANS